MIGAKTKKLKMNNDRSLRRKAKNNKALSFRA